MILLNGDIFMQHVKYCARQLLRKLFDNRWKQTGIRHDGRPNAQFACVRLFDELDLLQSLAHFVEHRDSGFKQHATVVCRLDSRNAPIKQLDT